MKTRKLLCATALFTLPTAWASEPTVDASRVVVNGKGPSCAMLLQDHTEPGEQHEALVRCVEAMAPAQEPSEAEQRAAERERRKAARQALRS
jgi:hypothetical protein